jgi:hypothetical protein
MDAFCLGIFFDGRGDVVDDDYLADVMQRDVF